MSLSDCNQAMTIRLLITIGVLGCVSGIAGPSFAGEVHGRILVTKTLTKRRVVLPDYQMRGVALPPKPETTQALDEYSRTVIYIDGGSPAAGKTATKTLDQKDIHFSPPILVIPVGSTVSFPNSDPIFHNVFSFSKAKQFDLGYYPAGETRTVKFDKVGIVQVYCHIHRDMNAAILVVPSDHYVQPDPDGMFTLADVTAGTHNVVVWHKSAGFFNKRVQVSAAGSVEVSFTIPVPTTE